MNEELEGLGLVDLYDKLVMPEPPVPVSMWPQTVGWIWLALALVVIAGLATWKYRSWRRATAYRRAALAELQRAGADPVAIAQLLRRTALAAFPREQVAGLHGSEWLAFLDAAGTGTTFANSSAGQVLIKAPYTAQPPDKDLPAMAAQWIRSHRAGQGAV